MGTPDVEESFNVSRPVAPHEVLIFFYYFIFESTSSQTLGKKITGTMVVNMNNEKPSLKRIFLRSLLRLNPFDWYSYAFGNEQGGHDLISKTRLIRKQR